MNLRSEKKLFLTPKKSYLQVDNLTFGANNSERAGNEVISWHLSSGCSFVWKNLGTRSLYRVKETHLLSRLIKVCLKETVERFHVFLFSKQHMISQILQNLKRITKIKLSFHKLATSYNLAKKGKTRYQFHHSLLRGRLGIRKCYF